MPCPTTQALQASFDHMGASYFHTKPSASPAIPSSKPIKYPSLLDTGATHNMFQDKSLFEPGSYTDTSSHHQTLEMAGEVSTLKILGKGTVDHIGPNSDIGSFKNCTYTPGLRQNLINGTQILSLV